MAPKKRPRISASHQILLVVLDHLSLSVFVPMRNKNVSIGILHQMDLHPIKKHTKLCNTNYWWLNFVHSDRRLDLALIMYNELTKVIERAMSTNLTLPIGTYLSYIFRKLGISTLGDTLISSNQPISYGAIHHVGYHFDANSGEWIKSGYPTTNENVDVEGIFEDIPSLEHVPSPTTSSQATQPSSDVNVFILDALHSLSNNVWGLKDEVRP